MANMLYCTHTIALYTLHIYVFTTGIYLQNEKNTQHLLKMIFSYIERLFCRSYYLFPLARSLSKSIFYMMLSKTIHLIDNGCSLFLSHFLSVFLLFAISIYFYQFIYEYSPPNST